MTYSNYAQPKSRQLRGAELIAAGFPELAASRKEDGRQRAATPMDGQMMSPTASVGQRTTVQSITPNDDRLKQKRWDNTPEMARFVAALCAEPRAGRRWMEDVARTAAAIGKPPQFTTELITKMLQPPAYPSEVADVVAAAYAQHGGVE